MTRILTAILAVGCIMLGVGISITSCPAMAAQPQQEWTQPVHKKPVAHKVAPKASTKPMEAPAVVCPEVAPVIIHDVAPPAPSYFERARAYAPTSWDWIKWPLGGLLIGGAITIIINAGRKVYAGYKASKGTVTQ